MHCSTLLGKCIRPSVCVCVSGAPKHNYCLPAFSMESLAADFIFPGYFLEGFVDGWREILTVTVAGLVLWAERVKPAYELKVTPKAAARLKAWNLCEPFVFPFKPHSQMLARKLRCCSSSMRGRLVSCSTSAAFGFGCRASFYLNLGSRSSPSLTRLSRRGTDLRAQF